MFAGSARLPIRDPRQLPRDHAPLAIHRITDDNQPSTRVTGPLARDPQLATLEAILLVADEPLPTKKLAQAAGLSDANHARRLLRKLQGLYDKDGTAFQVEELAGGFQLLTRPVYHRWLAALRKGTEATVDLRLTGPGKETLAIIAYRQPITRADIEVVRGVHCAEILRLLMEKGLVKIAGRDDSLGRPVLYGTTKKFLQVFGLKNLKDLPRAEEFMGK